MIDTDVAVIGLGAAGSAAIYHLGRMGVDACGIDRFVPPHSIGSTHGETRLIRKAYGEGTRYTGLVKRAYTLWEKLEKTWSSPLLEMCGCLNIGPANSTFLDVAGRAAALTGTPHTWLTVNDVHGRWPAVRIPDSCTALYDPEAGILWCDACVEAHLALARRAGARLFLGEHVQAWNQTGTGFQVVTNRRTFTARRLVLCAGAWTVDILPMVAPVLKVVRVTTSWFSPLGPHLDITHMPTVLYEYYDDELLYAVPDTGAGFKAGLHHVRQHVAQMDGADRVVSEGEIQATKEVLAGLVPDAAGRCTHATACFYTCTPDEHFYIDQIMPGLVIASACSGHGFKFSCAIGEALAHLVTGMPPPVSIEPFRGRWQEGPQAPRA